MSHALHRHPHFTSRADPSSGIVSYCLTGSAAPMVKGLYFQTPSMQGDSSLLWFRVLYPPAKQACLAAVRLDADQPDMRTYPEAVMAGNPLIAADGEGAWVPIDDGIHWRPFDGSLETVFRMPTDVIANRHLFRVVTDLTLSCDGRWFVLDSHIGNRYLISLVERETAAFTPLRWFPFNHHHAFFSPHDPDLFMVNHGPAFDPITGHKNDMNVRMWVMDTKLTRYEPVDPTLWFGRNSMGCHEWWTPEGRVNWCDYNDGIYEIDLGTRQKQIVWPRKLVHGMVDCTGRYYVGDENPYNFSADKPCGVWFFDRGTGREIAIAAPLPPHNIPWRDFRAYHIDPHPHFSGDGRWVIYTTTTDEGGVTVALVSVEEVLERLSVAGQPAAPEGQ